MPKERAKCIRCGAEMSAFKSFKQKFVYNQSFCFDPTISPSQILCDVCMYQLYKNLVYSVVDFLNESREIRQERLSNTEKKI
jgi:hypothetical protein